MKEKKEERILTSSFFATLKMSLNEDIYPEARVKKEREKGLYWWSKLTSAKGLKESGKRKKKEDKKRAKILH